MLILRRFLLASFLTVAASCSDPTSVLDRQIPRSVLFVGNSLTQTNNLPALVDMLADSAGFPDLTVGTLAGGGMSLLDHWLGAAPGNVDLGWDVVILQQGPTTTASGRVQMRMVAAEFADRIRKAGGQPGFYMVWPPVDNTEAFPDVSRTYRLAAEDVDGYLFPAGEVWLEIWRRNISMPLYGSDGFHPSPYGTYAAALSVIGTLYNRSVVGLPSRFRLEDGTSIWINPVDARVIQEATDEALRRHGRRP